MENEMWLFEVFPRQEQQLRKRIDELENILAELEAEDAGEKPIMIIKDGERTLEIFTHSYSNSSKVRTAIREFMRGSNV